MKKKKVFIIIILTIIVSIMFMNTSNAALQSNNGTKKAYNISNWLKNIRNMEASGGTFGLNAEIDENSLLDKGASNGLDVHMEKNTEYGALAILSASSYGNAEVIANGGTTTGNSTGAIIQNGELVSALASNKTYSEEINKIDNRYRNLYEIDANENSKYFKGDAMEETQGWQNSEFQNIKTILVRSGYLFELGYPYSGKSYSFSNIFSAYTNNKYKTLSEWWNESSETDIFPSRAVVVIGDGI